MEHRLKLVIGLILFSSGLLFGQIQGTIGRMGPCNDDDDRCTTIPRIIYSPAPEYSDQARKAKQEGTCYLTLVVGVDGHTSEVRVISGLGMGLDEKAIEAVKKWTFGPATRRGKPVPVKIAVAIDFDCQGKCSATVPRSDLIKLM
jgi:TonB family protein